VEHKKAEELASSILQEFGPFCAKLRSMKSKIEKLRDYFKAKDQKETVAGCSTWAQFCERKLHRTDRAVRLLLAEETSASPEAKKPKAKAEKKADYWDRALKSLSNVLLITDDSEDLQRKLLQLLTELFPDREFVDITIKETTPEVAPEDSKPMRGMSRAASKKIPAKKAAKQAPAAAQEVAS